MKIYLIFTLLFSLLFSAQGHGFVLLSGPDEATLNVSPSAPSIAFYWDGSAPPLTAVEELAGGKWFGLSNEDVMEQIILLAFEKWNEVPGSYLHLALVKDDTTVSDSKDYTHTVVVSEESNITTAAFALPIITEKRIVDCDISISTKSTSAQLMAYTMIHEIGHCLGLGHAHSNYGAIMGYARRPSSLNLGADDMAGVIYLYTDPLYRTERKEFLGCAAIGQGVDDGKSFILLFLLLFPLLISVILKTVIPRHPEQGLSRGHILLH